MYARDQARQGVGGDGVVRHESRNNIGGHADQVGLGGQLIHAFRSWRCGGIVRLSLARPFNRTR